jgi:hypothetical protein
MQLHYIQKVRHLGLEQKPPTPTPPLPAYADWLAGYGSQRAALLHVDRRITPEKLRRIVVMRKHGESWREIERSLAMPTSAAHNWVKRLPLELQP